MSGTILHVEVVGKDQELLQGFYKDLLGWDLDTSNPGGYGMHRQGELTAGIGATPDGSAGHVTFYVKTDDPHAAIARAEAKGGTLVMPYAEVSPDVKFALIADPEGHVIGIM